MPSLIEKATEVSKGQDDEVEAVPAGAAVENHAEADYEPLVPESNGKVDEDTRLKLTECADTPECLNGVSEVQHDEALVSTDWNSAPLGWTSAEPPTVLDNGMAHVGTAAATTESGLLASVPAAKAVEKPAARVYNFYMVKVPRPVGRHGKAEIIAAGKNWLDKQELRRVQNDTMQEARAKRNEACEKRRAARQVERDWFLKIREKVDQISPLKVSLKKIKDVVRDMREKSRDLPKSEEELDHTIAFLEWRIQHESIPLKLEKQLMREIKQLQASRENVRQHATLFNHVNKAMGQRDDLESALKPLETELKQLEAERKAAKLQLEKSEDEYNKMNAAFEAVLDQLQSANGTMQDAYAHHRILKDQEYLRMKDHYDNKRDIQEAKLLASKQYNSEDVEAFCNAQIERMLEMWNVNDEFRKNYVKDNEVSTVRRFGTLDGRSLGPDEVRPVLANADAPFSTVPASLQHGGRAGASVKETAPAREGKVETVAAAVEEAECTLAPVAEERPAPERDAQKLAAPSPVVDTVKSNEELEREAADLKKQRRAIEMNKAKDAEERKKRTAERAQAKAQAWAQKEAEKKEKEKEKKARKKSAAVVPTESSHFTNSNPVESADSVAVTQKPNPEETKVDQHHRKRGVTDTHKQAAMAIAPTRPVRVKQQKLFCVPLQVVLGAGVAGLLAVLVFLFLRGDVWISASGSENLEFFRAF